ncbi:MAG: hypothetical protein OSA48_04610 [Akkermansiaceae bacterium]|nr:hypothetical protein [Akkermansiaceae bacterium]
MAKDGKRPENCAYASTKKIAATQRKADVHYTREGSQLLAEQVVRSTNLALDKKWPNRPPTVA